MKKIISFLLVVTMVISAFPAVSIATQEAQSVNEGLILYYDFETDMEYPDTIEDKSGNGNDAKVINTYTSEMTKELSVKNGVACFPGFGYIDDVIVKGAALSLPNGVNEGVETFTYSAWVKASWACEGNMRLFDFGNLGSGRNNTYNSIFTRLTMNDETLGNALRIQDREISSSASDPAGFVETSTSAFDNEWALYTLVYEKNEETGYYETTAYINGNKVPALSTKEKFTRSLDDLGALNNTTNGMLIGRSVWTEVDKFAHENPDFMGQMDEIRLYNRALSEDEVNYLYSNTRPFYQDFITGFTVPVLTVYEGDEITFPAYVEYNTAFSDTELVPVSWFRDEDDVDTSVLGMHKIDGVTKYDSVVMVIHVIKKSTTAENGLLLYYDFEEDGAKPSTIKDKSGNGNDAKVLNTVSGSTNHYISVDGGVAKFPGMSASYLGAALKLPNTINRGVSSFTYSAWIKADSSYRYANKMTRFFDFGNIASGPRDSIFARYTSSSGNMYIQDRYLQKSKETTLSDKPFTDKWGLFTLVYAENESTGYYELKVYVNGEEVSALNSTNQFTRGLSDLGELNDSTNGMYIGRTVWAATGNYVTDNPDFCGEMDEIRLYARALTKAEIVELFETTNPAKDREVVDYIIEDVTTNVGSYPSLPDNVMVIYNTGESEAESVTWDAISAEKYASEGTFEVNGVTKSGLAVSVKVIVENIDLSASLKEGLVVYYNFDNDGAEPDTIADASGNGNDATVLKTVQTVTTNVSSGTVVDVNNVISVEDGVASFPGYTQLLVGNQMKTYQGAALRMPSNVNKDIEDFTYSAWIQADTGYEFASGLQRLFDFGNLSNNYNSFYFRYVPTSGYTRFQDRYIVSNGEDASSYVAATLSDKPFNDKWAHLAVTYKKQNAGYYVPTIYINGEEREEYNKTITTLTRSLKDLGNLSNSTNALLIGRTIWTANNSNVSTNPDFKGKMDEIRLYNRALTESEIRELYSAHKPSDMELDEYKIPITEDVEVTREKHDQNLNGASFITVSSGDYDTYTHFGLMRATDISNAQKLLLKDSGKIILNMYVMMPLGTAEGEYYCYGLSGDYNSWNVDTIQYSDYIEHIYGSVVNSGESTAGELVDTYYSQGGVESFYIQFDVTDFVKVNIDDFSFLISTNCRGAYMVASEFGGENAPAIIAYVQDVPIEVNCVDTEGNQISNMVVYGDMGESYTYEVKDYLIKYNGSIYAVDEEKSTLVIDKVDEDNEITVVYSKAEDVTVSVSDVVTYVGKAPALPSVVTVAYGEHSAPFAAQWAAVDEERYAKVGEFTASGIVSGTEVPISANVTVFPEYNGAAGGDLTLCVYVDGELYEEKAVEGAYGESFTLDETYEKYLGNCYRLEKVTGDITAIGDSIVMDELNQRVNLYFVITEEITGELSVEIKADNVDETSYTLTITATVLNTKVDDEEVSLIIADYNGDALENAEAIRQVIESRTGEYITIAKSMTYLEARDKDKVIYLWGEDMVPLADAVKLADVKVEGYLPEEVSKMMPTKAGATSAVKKSNDYWQSNYSYNQSTNGLHIAFWDTATYHTGNIEAYKLTGDEDYLDYSVNWANYCDWTGNNYEGEPSTWTWTYDQTQGSNAVLFGDWQTCFHTFIDLYDLGVEDADLDRVYEVMDYQVSNEEDGYWWWADGLYMVMPVLSKLYRQSEDEKYLDALYKYFKYAKELMYDGPGGIPTDEDGYTTSAALKNGASYADADDYKYLFYRDGNYVYPLRPNVGHEKEKNFWARGNGWVFAALAKVLSDMPETYEHYDEFLTTYKEMAEAIISCQETDDEGYGFWTQSMLQNYPVGNNDNDEGYETSGTAFFTYGLFWGINNGILDKEMYLESAVRAWGYLENVALHDNGKVGYVQPIGSNATQAIPYSRTVNFGVGAFLLAGCEAARYAENN